MRLSRPIEGKIKTCTITREADGWYASFACEVEPKRIKHPSTETVGVDVGIESFATLSTGEQIENPKFLRASEKDLKRPGGKSRAESFGATGARKRSNCWQNSIKRSLDKEKTFTSKSPIDLSKISYDQI